MARVLFGTSSWGLGHATRDLVLMRALLAAGMGLTVVSTGKALAVLREELGPACRYLDWPDIPPSVAATGTGFYARTIANIPEILATWFAEKRRLGRYLSRHPQDLVISDHRYGLVTREAPCFFISHSLRYIAPWRDSFMEGVMENFLSHWLAPVRAVFIPDDREGGLSGDMSHRLRFVPREKRCYLGILSSLQRRACAEDVDVFVSISGPEPQRTLLEKLALAQSPRLAGKVVLALGKNGAAPPRAPAVTIHAYLNRAAQEDMMNRSRLVVCRSGYTTLMELAELGRRALLVPTPGQSEQLYLARTLRRRGLYHSVAQRGLDLARDVPLALGFPGYRPGHPTAVSVRRFLGVLAAALACRSTRGAA
jgi:hypothetical protein